MPDGRRERRVEEVAPGPQKPTIAVAASSQADAQPCAEAVERSDGEPRILLPGDSLSARDRLTGMGGLLLCGGQERVPHASPRSKDGHAFELPLLKFALKSDMPVLCIGLGMQALNLAMGGKPTQDVTGHGAHEGDGDRVSSYHRIYISPGCKLAAVVGSGGVVRVNSRHRQGAREAQKSPLLLASAYSLEDGVIEALESPDHRWVIAVQFHPERRLEIPPHFERLFQSLVERAGEYMNPVNRAKIGL